MSLVVAGCASVGPGVRDGVGEGGVGGAAVGPAVAPDAPEGEQAASTDDGDDVPGPPSQGPDFRKTAFKNLRFDEDWRWLGEPGASTDHDWPEAKHIDVGDGWSLSVGGQARSRTQFETNRSLTGADPNRNSFHLWRARLHADLRHTSGWRVFVEALDARIRGESRPPIPIDRNDADLHNAFVEYSTDGGTTWRLGRFELQQGNQRLVSPLDWGNTRRRFEGGLVNFDHGDGSSTEVFVTKPMIVRPEDTDDDDRSRIFSGVYHSRPALGDRVDVFAYQLRERDDLFTSEEGGPSGDRDLYTLGARYYGKEGDTDYELWYAQQFGDQAGDQIDAFAASARVGHTFSELDGKPRLGLDVDHATGDDDPTDGRIGTFDQLFPLGHAWLGHFDLVARQNITAVSPSITYDLDERTKMRAAFHRYRLAEAADAFYNAGGVPTFADPTGDAGRDAGDELNLTLVHRPEFLGPHGHVLLGWAHFMPGERVDDLGGDGTADLLYLQLTYTF